MHKPLPGTADSASVHPAGPSPSTESPARRREKALGQRSLAQTLVIVICTVFLGELLIMAGLELAPPIPAWIEIVLDAAILASIVFVLLRKVIVSPLERLLRAYARKSDDLRQARSALEAKVVQRTSELRVAKDRLEKELEERRRLDEVLEQANENLSASVSELELQKREVRRLSEFGSLLHASRSEDEAARLVGEYGNQLFSGDSGAFFMLSASRNYLEQVAIWGNHPPGQVFAPDECWALRRGRLHHRVPGESLPQCGHNLGNASERTICAPLIGQGDMLGVMHLRVSTTTSPDADTKIDDAKEQLFSAFAENVALGFANLKLREELQCQAIRDPLTSLHNRRYMVESLDRELRRAARKQTTVGIIMMDIDHLKRFNDSFGHDAGDTMIKEVGHVLQRGIRPEDIACRYGGEEFLIILPEADLETSLKRAEELRGRIERIRAKHQGRPLNPVTASFGVAVFPDHGESVEVVVRSADEALYKAKKEGRNRSEVFLEVC